MTISQCHCGKEFTKIEGQKYCSPSCRLSNYIPHPHLSLLRFCSQCNKEFMARNKEQQFCSHRCRGISGRGSNFIEPYKNCQQCNTKIDNPTKHKKYCNQCRERRKKDTSQRDAERFRLEHNYHICANCNVRFYSKKKGQQRKSVMFCSERCRHEKLNASLYKSNNFFTSPELIVAEILNQKDILFTHNYSISSYFVDFLLPNKVIIECDIIICSGRIHSHCDHVKDRELRRDLQLKQWGYIVIRLSEEIIFSSSLIKEIDRIITTNAIKCDQTINHDFKTEYLTTSQIASIYRVWPATVRSWIKKGKITGAFQPAFQTAGIWLIPRKDFEEFYSTNKPS